MKARFGTKQETIGEFIGTHTHGFCDQTIKRVWLISRASHQRVESGINASRTIALEHIDVECVEGLEILIARCVLDLQHKRAAFGRLRIHISKVFEIGWLFQFTECREAMCFNLARSQSAAPAEVKCCQRSRAAHQRVPACDSDALARHDGSCSDQQAREVSPRSGPVIRKDYVAFLSRCQLLRHKPPRCSATAKMSLSPRPHRFITIR